jgi:hypothetical protein
MLLGALDLLRGGSAEDILQLLIHLAHPIAGGHGQRIQKRSHNGHILVGLGESGELSRPGLPQAPIHIGVGRPVWHQWPPAHRRAPPSPRGFAFDFILWSVSSFLLMSHRLLGEGPGVWSRYGGLLQCHWYGLKCWGFL